ncbi:HAD-superfamily hydrolase [Basidiobolus meristosporus CBS 931.73]|uniref:HAD-superfamily hydrolase n=1 Tax=Basidiobolus meristosporus CBS 931.73 TaxID=1314790 RepID=A0A1Y1YU36_9FUNG|nr:HAD-superfamily hydrolase [Basidiobolus meristosporus CBS 931.73]|eukprot:ORY01247.1 HAD-superfamily hydrolase [Basidiobolus meristosporus CBS 931.73]
MQAKSILNPALHLRRVRALHPRVIQASTRGVHTHEGEGSGRRPLTHAKTDFKASLEFDLIERYYQKKQQIFSDKSPSHSHLKPSHLIQNNQVFANNDINLGKISVYGFDYDYTLANYSEMLPIMIYTKVRDMLVDHLKYPTGLKDLTYDPKFAIRGLHYDFQTGWMMKIDAFHNIQLTTVHYGREPIKNQDLVTGRHHGIHVSPQYLSKNMRQLIDMFSIPEACLLADVIQYFIDHQIRYLADDIWKMGRLLHTADSTGLAVIHVEMMKSIDVYLKKNPTIVEYLENLRRNGKKLFLLTNSSYAFVDRGLSYMTSSNNWRNLFDVCIFASNKPHFYNSSRPFRKVHTCTSKYGTASWDYVNSFNPGEVYQGGNIKQFSKLTGWTGGSVMYIGDNIYSDLIDPASQQGWRTGAIISELEEEINTHNSEEYRRSLQWMLELENLIRKAQSECVSRTDTYYSLVESLREERREYREKLKDDFNPHFGSVFRTHTNPTYFANKVCNFADLYTSKLENFKNHPIDYIFYPERMYLPHERLSAAEAEYHAAQ